MVMARTAPPLAVISLPLEGQSLQVHKALVEMGIDYTVTYQGEHTDNSGWQHDEWMFKLTRYEGAVRKEAASMRHAYRTGTGHRKPKPGTRPFDGRKNTLYHEDWVKAHMRAVEPLVAGLIYSLLSDAEGATDTFGNWCAELGYDDDSIKALNTYRACQEIRDQLHRFFAAGQLDTLRALLEDY